MSKSSPVHLVSWLAVVVLGFVLAGCSPPTDEELIAQSEAALAKGDYAAARIHLMNILQRDDDNVEARIRLADLDLDAGKAEVAASGYQRVLKLEPGNLRAIAGRAQALALDGGNGTASVSWSVVDAAERFDVRS